MKDYSVENQETVIEIEVERLRPFHNHPFKVEDDEQMVLLKESIRLYGILTPLIVRPILEGAYEIISGHRRRKAAMDLGYRKVPVIIRKLDDNAAVIAMVDSNFQRQKVLPSEKANAYKMKYEALKRKPGKKIGGQDDYKLKGIRTVSILGEESGDSAKQVQRYLKLTWLIPELMQMLDEGKLAFNPAVELAYLTKKEQEIVLEAIDYAQGSPSLSQAQRIKYLSQNKEFTPEIVQEILTEIKKGEIQRVVFKNEQLYRYFPASYSPARIKREILAILKLWKERYWDE